jgi:hypothetical protein
MRRIERRDIRATECHSAACRAVGSGWSTQPNGHRDLRPPLATGRQSQVGKKLRTKKNSLETEVSKLLF